MSNYPRLDSVGLTELVTKLKAKIMGEGYVKKVTASYEESPTLYSHAQGEYIYYDGYVYKTLSSIAQGANLVVDTNIALAVDVDLTPNTPVYITNIPDTVVQEGVVLVDASNVEYTRRDKIKFGNGFSITDDTTNSRMQVDLTTAIQSDWNQTDSTALDFIKNKPSVNDVTLVGNKTSSDLGLADAGTVEAMVNVNGSKNILPNNASSKTANNVTFTVNSDGSITVSTSGAVSANTRCEIVSSITLTQSSILSGGPSGSSGITYVLFAYDGNTYYGDLEEKGVILSAGTYFVGIIVYSGTTISTPITFYPMLRDARISDDTYAPYAMTNRELTEREIVIVVTPTQAQQEIPYPRGFTISNSMIVSAQYKSSTRGFNAYDVDSQTYPMPYYHTNGIIRNSSSVDTTTYTKLAICLRKI